ncbi:hypothetical protein Taro_034068 [Colocasia esculenta]|uniref:Uncharacterized protein n=1 Tax=Colocasia esculenta TaxID=4460 RepID=A0A843VQB8_COLES|nr:hypothetical protein [Colocasia esculenta]
MTSSKSPVFPMPEPQHYSDDGFDPRLHHFQAMDETTRHGNRETTFRDALGGFMLQKPTRLEDDQFGGGSPKNHRGSRWWRNTLLFFKRKRSRSTTGEGRSGRHHAGQRIGGAPLTPACSTLSYPSSPWPVYSTESSDAGSWTPYRSRVVTGWGCRLSCAGPPGRRLAEVGNVEVPYLCLRDSVASGASPPSASYLSQPPASVPIYLVT